MITEYIVIWRGEQYPFDDFDEALHMAKYLVADEIYPLRCKALILEVESTNFDETSRFPSVMLVEWIDTTFSNCFMITRLM